MLPSDSHSSNMLVCSPEMENEWRYFGHNCETNHSPPFSAEVKNTWNYTSTVPYVFAV